MNSLKQTVISIGILFLFACQPAKEAPKLPDQRHNLIFSALPVVWDEAIPLGNGLTGALLWQKEGRLRLGLDRADLWDLRPVEQFNSPNHSFEFIYDQVVNKKDLQPVYRIIDDRTALDPAPTKIPAGAIEIDISSLGPIAEAKLDVATATALIRWKNGTEATFFVHAGEKGGRFRFENLPDSLHPQLLAPLYEENNTELDYQPGVNKLTALGYRQGDIIQTAPGTLLYQQQAWGDVSYEIALQYNMPNKHTLIGKYIITSKGTPYSEAVKASDLINNTPTDDFSQSHITHTNWWKNYWEKSSITLPDSLLEKQWYLEMYKFASASRKDAPPISLQAVWTADNGQTPPWRGDFHSDLNTQLSYWPGYTANHLEETSVFTDWLWQIKDNSEKFTRQFFKTDGMNVACIATLTGEPIGGWSAYSHSPTAAGWLAHHFYLQWKYSMDKEFLQYRAYPWVKEVARFFGNISVWENGKRKLPLSTSPEINDNKLDAWFTQTTNYDLANIRLTYTVAHEMARALSLSDEADNWQQQLDEWPLPTTDRTGLMIAPSTPLNESHRHFSHMLSFHPFALIDVTHGNEEAGLILRSIKHLEDLGPDFWTGYTYAWMANMKARVFDGGGVLRNLHIFIKAFCSSNSFHLNGDQTKSRYSRFTYRPFTLEGNFACAAAIQEMLLQSHTDVIRVFPAIPEKWENASFTKLRAMGAFLVSAVYENGKTSQITIESEKGGVLNLLNPFTNSIIKRNMKPGEIITFTKDNPQ